MGDTFFLVTCIPVSFTCQISITRKMNENKQTKRKYPSGETQLGSKFFFLSLCQDSELTYLSTLFCYKAPHQNVTDSLWFQGRIKKMVREMHKLLCYCQKEKWQYYMLKGFPDSQDRLSLEIKQCFAESLVEFAVQNLPICKFCKTQYS